MLTLLTGRLQSFWVRHRILCLLLLAAIGAAGPAQAGSWSVTATLTGSSTPSGSGQLIYKFPSSFSSGGFLQGTQSATFTQTLYMPNPRPTMSESGAASLSLNYQIVFTITWVPTNNNALTDPPPPFVAFYYGRQVQASASAENSVNGDATSASVTGGVGSITNSASSFGGTLGQLITDTAPTVSDSALNAQVLTTTSGSAQMSFSINGTLGVQVSEGGTTSGATASSTLTCTVSLAVAGIDLGRYGTPLAPLAQGRHDGSSDPTFTRWLPLSFSPQFTAQPYRTASGPLPAPWGNINCLYSMAVTQEPTTPNYDLDGYPSLYVPGLGSNGTYTNGIGPYQAQPGPFVPMYALTDANGDRLLFNATWTPDENVHSTITTTQNTVVLSNAGPPGSLRDVGHYTYTFQKMSAAPAPLTARLVSIADDLGNVQTLTWGSGSPLLNVTDSSSGRALLFYSTTSGYIASVDAPEISGSTPHTHTVLVWDGNGHVEQVNVYTGNGATLLHQDLFGYGGPNGDSVTSSTQGVSVSAFTYATDSYVPDAVSLPVPRLATASYGNANDTSSSDSGVSIQGTYHYTYGPTQQGYNEFNLAASTNTTTDPNGNVFTTTFSLINNYGAIFALSNSGPSYTGAPLNSNQTSAFFSPNIDQPTQANFYDALYAQGLSTQPWQTSYDAYGNLTNFTDPLGNAWNYVYAADGIELTQVTDPTNSTIELGWGENGHLASRLTSITDPAGCTTSLTYNTFGQPITILTPATFTASGQNEETTAFYAASTGDLTTVTDPAGNQLVIGAYDALGDPTTTSVYPDTGNPLTSTTPLTSTAQWDASQMPVQELMPNGVTASNTWANGILTQIQCNAPPALGGATLAQMNLGYDSRGRVYALSDLMGSLTQYRFDKNSNPTKILDGRGNVTKLTYGPNNEFTGATWPDGVHSTSRLYDAAGRESQTTDERGVVCSYLYDVANRLTDLQFPATSAQNVHVTYDAASRPLTRSDASGTRTYTYDPITKRLTSVTTTLSLLPAGANTYTVGYDYYGDSKLHHRTLTIGGVSYQTAYTWDVNGRLQTLSTPQGDVITWQYDHIGRTLHRITLTSAGATLETSYSWGGSNLAGDPSTAPAYLSQITQTVNGKAFWVYHLTHSLLGQLEQVAGTGSSSAQTLAVSYSYDLRGRLTGYSKTYHADATHVFTKSGSYSYDLSNNLNGGAGGWTYNSDNELTAAPPLGDLPGATNLTYGPDGSLSTLNNHSFSYDPWGDLSSITNTNVGTLSFTYDSEGDRVSKSSSTETLAYLYDGDTLIGQTDGNGNLTVSYNWGPDGLLSDFSGTTSRNYMQDPEGDTSALIDENGNTLAQQVVASPVDGGVLAGTAPQTPFDQHAADGWYTDSEVPDVICSGDVPYVPGTGQYGAPSWVGGIGGSSPYALPGNNPVATGGNGGFGGSEDEAPDADILPAGWNGENLPYRPFLNATHVGAGIFKQALLFAAGFNPIEQAREGISGVNAVGCAISPGQRVLDLVAVVLPGIHNASAVEDAVEEIKIALPTQSEIIKQAYEAERQWREWLIDQDVILVHKPHGSTPGPDAFRIGGEHLGWDWAELKAATRKGMKEGGEQIRDRFREGYTGTGARYVYKLVDGKYKFAMKGRWINGKYIK